MNVNTTTKKALFIVGLLLAVPLLHLAAQPPGLGDPSGAPIDGGISLLVAAGIGYGAKKVRDARKAKQAAGNKDDAAGI